MKGKPGKHAARYSSLDLPSVVLFPDPPLRLALVLSVLVLASCSRERKAEQVAPPKRFGIELVQLAVQDTVVARGQTFAALLRGAGLDARQVHEATQACRTVFDPRRLRSGMPLHLLRDSVSGALRHLVYEPDPLCYLRLDLADSLPRAELVQRERDTVLRAVDGTVEGSLWQSMTALGHSPELVDRMADVLAWQVDFFAVQPGDRFRVLYEDIQVGGRSVAVGAMRGVWFEQDGTKTEAILFERDERPGYFDGEGHPARRALLKAPLKFSRISSGFSEHRFHPVLRITRPHHGVDYAAPAGTPVHAVGDGVVIARGWAGGGGNMIKLRHDGTPYMSGYMHLKGFAPGIRPGARVSQGQLIGWVGATGIATGPHLDFRLWRSGTPVNPVKVVSPPMPPLSGSSLVAFQARRDQVRSELESGLAVARRAASRDTTRARS